MTESASLKSSRYQPLFLTPLVGRDEAIQLITEMILDEQRGIITLTGPAGVGKTRIAVSAAETIAGQFRHGARFIDLSLAGNADELVDTITRALEVPENPQLSTRDRLEHYLDDLEALLLFDNFEQLLETGPILNELIVNAPEVQSLVTSRAALRVSGEREFIVRPLGIPETRPGQSPAQTVDLARKSPAVELFVQRASATDSVFALTESNVEAILQICRHLDGIPLAIELAAARTKVLAPRAMLTRLEHSLELLTGGARDAPSRHQTLRNAISWSYELLQPEEQQLFRRLSVFAYGFSLVGAEIIGGDDPDPGNVLDIVADSNKDESDRQFVSVSARRLPQRLEILSGLTALVDHSLLLGDDGGVEGRFRMLETIREFALEKLDESGEGIDIRRRHADLYYLVAERSWTSLGNPAIQREWLDRMSVNHANLLEILEWLEEHDVEQMLSTEGALCWYWYLRGLRAEGQELIERGLKLAEGMDIDTSVRARALFTAGLLALFQARPEAKEYLQEARELWTALDNTWGIGVTGLSLGIIEEDAGNYDQARDLMLNAMKQLEVDGDATTIATGIYHLGVVEFGLGNLDQAENEVRRIIDLSREEWPRSACYCLHLLGLIEIRRGNLAQAASYLSQNLKFARDLGMPSAVAESMAAIATLSSACGQHREAAEILGAAETHAASIGFPFVRPECEIYDEYREQSRSDLGEAAYQEAFEAGQRLTHHDAFASARNLLDRPDQQVTSAPTREAPQRAPTVTPPQPISHGLTARELEVLKLVADGSSDKQIAGQLFISYGTARTHVRNILQKLDVNSRAAAASIALREGIV